MPVRVYHSKHCKPCEIVTKLIKQGRFEGEEEVELVDLETEEGFKEFYNHVLEHRDSAVPSAYKDGERCLIKITEDNDALVFECPGEASTPEVEEP